MVRGAHHADAVRVNDRLVVGRLDTSATHGRPHAGRHVWEWAVSSPAELPNREKGGEDANDVFSINSTTGQWFVASNDGTGALTFAEGGWAPGWQVKPVDLNNDGFDDMFLYNPVSGTFYKAMNNRAGGFNYRRAGGRLAGRSIPRT